MFRCMDVPSEQGGRTSGKRNYDQCGSGLHRPVPPIDDLLQSSRWFRRPWQRLRFRRDVKLSLTAIDVELGVLQGGRIGHHFISIGFVVNVALRHRNRLLSELLERSQHLGGWTL